MRVCSRLLTFSFGNSNRERRSGDTTASLRAHSGGSRRARSTFQARQHEENAARLTRQARLFVRAEAAGESIVPAMEAVGLQLLDKARLGTAIDRQPMHARPCPDDPSACERRDSQTPLRGRAHRNATWRPSLRRWPLRCIARCRRARRFRRSPARAPFGALWRSSRCSAMLCDTALHIISLPLGSTRHFVDRFADQIDACRSASRCERGSLRRSW